MMQWHTLNSVHDVEHLIDRSRVVPCMIFKHSTSCPISAMAKRRLEMNWETDGEELETYYLDLLRHRDVSNLIADSFGVRHESPQVLVIKDGNCVYDASHLRITAEAISGGGN